MGLAFGTCECILGQDSQHEVMIAALSKRKRFDQNYGAITMVMGYLPRLEQLKMQGLDTWQYDVGVGRVQVRLEVPPQMFYFVDVNDGSQIIAVRDSGEYHRFDYEEESDFSNDGWLSCQIGRSRLFQYKDESFRILKFDPNQRSFTVKKSGAGPEISNPSTRFSESTFCMTNFKNQFIFLFTSDQPIRYSLAEDRWKQLPPHEFSPSLACSLGEKVYVFAFDFGYKKNLIHVLHNPGASISSHELHWQVIEVPRDVFTTRFDDVAFVPLNSTEIAILGGLDDEIEMLGDVITFNTSTCEFMKELETDLFLCYKNQSAKVYENTIIALGFDTNRKLSLIKYTKGDTSTLTIQSQVKIN